jgi:hypothetical protein
MAKKFDPAPADKHAADPKQAEKADKVTSLTMASKVRSLHLIR